MKICVEIICFECGRLLGVFFMDINEKYIGIQEIDFYCHTCEKRPLINMEMKVEK